MGKRNSDEEALRRFEYLHESVAGEQLSNGRRRK
jgi:hypothetical protein